MDPDSSAGLSDASTDLEQFQPERAGLSTAGKLGTLEIPTQQPEQAVGEGVEKQAKLIGQEAVTAEPICFEFQFELFDTILRLAPEHVDLLIDPVRLK